MILNKYCVNDITFYYVKKKVPSRKLNGEVPVFRLKYSFIKSCSNRSVTLSMCQAILSCSFYSRLLTNADQYFTKLNKSVLFISNQEYPYNIFLTFELLRTRELKSHVTLRNMGYGYNGKRMDVNWSFWGQIGVTRMYSHHVHTRASVWWERIMKNHWGSQT